MSWKSEELRRKFTVRSCDRERMYTVLRQYVRIDDILITDDGESVHFMAWVKNKNISRLEHDIRVMRICGLDILYGGF